GPHAVAAVVKPPGHAPPARSPPPPPAVRPTAQPPYRRRGDRLRPRLGGPGPRGSGDHRRYRALRRPPPGRRPPPSRHRPAPPRLRALPGHRAGALQHDRPGGRRAVRAGPPPHRHPRPLRGLDPLPPTARSHHTAIRAV